MAHSVHATMIHQAVSTIRSIDIPPFSLPRSFNPHRYLGTPSVTHSLRCRNSTSFMSSSRASTISLSVGLGGSPPLPLPLLFLLPNILGISTPFLGRLLASLFNNAAISLTLSFTYLLRVVKIFCRVATIVTLNKKTQTLGAIVVATSGRRHGRPCPTTGGPTLEVPLVYCEAAAERWQQAALHYNKNNGTEERLTLEGR